MKRREFAQMMGAGLLASSLPVALAACQTSSTVGATGGREAEFAPLGTVADLDAAGVLVDGSFNGANVAVVRDPDAPDTLIAVSARCTHSGCTVDWNGDRGLFICPCHGAQFATDGTPQAGPARNSLTRYEAKIEDDQILVRV